VNESEALKMSLTFS